jgi:benzoate-CoA ligase
MNANITLRLLDAHLSIRPDKPAYVCGERVCTYRGLAANVNRFASYLESVGVAPGDRVGLAMADSLAFVYAVLGCIRRGAMPVMILPVLKRTHCEHILNDCGARMLFADPGVEAAQAQCPAGPTILLDEERVEALLHGRPGDYPAHAVGPEELALMFYTSGTTGHPKGAPHRHGDVGYVMDAFPGDVLRVSENDLIFSPSKMFHVYGFGNSILTTLTFGATALLVSGPMSPGLALETIERYKPTLLYCVPTLYSAMLQLLPAPVRFERLRACVAAGEPTPAAVLRAWVEKTGQVVYNGYGATETLFVTTGCRLDPERPVTGPMLRHFEGKIVNENGVEVPDGEPGILLLRGPAISPCYWESPEWSAKAMSPDGWWRSGDLFVKHGKTYNYLGRNDDMFKVGGQWVSPVQVESALLSHPAVKACAVTAVIKGGLAQARAHVVLGDAAPDAEELELLGLLRRHVLEQLPKYMCPSEVIFCTELPMTASGKIQRFKLREIAA